MSWTRSITYSKYHKLDLSKLHHWLLQTQTSFVEVIFLFKYFLFNKV